MRNKNDKNNSSNPNKIKKMVDFAKHAITTTVESFPSGMQKHHLAHRTTVPSRRVSEKHLSLVPKKVGNIGISHRPHYSKPAKLAPGTRTKMLKVIYDNRRDLAEQRRKSFMVRWFMAFVLVVGLGLGINSFWGWMQETVYDSTFRVFVSQWWDKVTAPQAPVPVFKQPVHQAPQRIQKPAPTKKMRPYSTNQRNPK